MADWKIGTDLQLSPLQNSPARINCLSMDVMQKIEKALRRRNLKWSDLARLTGLTSSRLSKWKTGTGEPGLAHGWLIAEALDLPIEYLANPAIKEEEDVASERRGSGAGADPGGELTEDERMLLAVARVMRGGAREALRRIIDGGDRGAGPPEGGGPAGGGGQAGGGRAAKGRGGVDMGKFRPGRGPMSEDDLGGPDEGPVPDDYPG